MNEPTKVQAGILVRSQRSTFTCQLLSFPVLLALLLVLLFLIDSPMIKQQPGLRSNSSDVGSSDMRGEYNRIGGLQNDSGGMMGDRHLSMMGHHGGGMMGNSQGMMGDGPMYTIHNLLDYRYAIDRTVSENDTMGTTETTSDNPQVANWIQQHVATMMELVENRISVRPWDPLFVQLVEHADEITMTPDFNDPRGVKVTMDGHTVCGRTLAKMHAAVVSLFIEMGYDELHKSHDVPSYAMCE